MQIKKSLILPFILTSFLGLAQDLKQQFKNPPFEFRAYYPFQGAAGTRYKDTIPLKQQLDKVYDHFGFGGVIVAPTDIKPFVAKANGTPGYMAHVGNGLQVTLPIGASPWLMTLPKGIPPYKYEADQEYQSTAKPDPLPAYLSKEHFDRLKQIAAYSKEKGRKVVFYDEMGYPSGIANHTTPEKYYRKLLEKSEVAITGPAEYHQKLPDQGKLMALVAMNITTHERIDLTSDIKNNTIQWKVPQGEWKIMTFHCVTSKATGGELDYRVATDFLDIEASQWFVDKVYEPHARALDGYFGNTIIQTFFDDVGIFDEEKTWTSTFNEKFKERTGLDAAIYYPALWENIGVETEAARAAFFDTRAELLANGFPKVVADWGKKNNIIVSGHCPGNYDPQPVDMNGDPFKFYKDIPVPMVDVIFAYPTGRDGFKLISDGAAYYDKPVVAGETFNSFSPAGKTAGYRRLMELYVRGVNRLLGSGLPKEQAANNTDFAQWIGRSSMMLQGGRRISDIAIFYPIADLEAFYRFDAPEYTKDYRFGNFVPYDNDFMAIGEMLLGEVHRDFTFLHPDFLLSDKVQIKGSTLKLNNKADYQAYKVLILPGQRVISLKALQKIKAYYDQGGVVIGTSLLPSKAVELTGDKNKAQANDLMVQEIIKEMFGIDSQKAMPDGISAVNLNKRYGKAVFIRKPDADVLAQTFDRLNIQADVVLEGNPSPTSGGGMLSFIHKLKDNRNLYYFANSSDDVVDTYAEVKGKITPELWNPETGEIHDAEQVEHLKKNGQDVTRFKLNLKAVSSVFVVSANK